MSVGLTALCLCIAFSFSRPTCAGEIIADVTAIVRERVELHAAHERTVEPLRAQQRAHEVKADRLAKALTDVEAVNLKSDADMR